MSANVSNLKKDFIYKYKRVDGISGSGVFAGLETTAGQTIVVFKNRANLARETVAASEIQSIDEYAKYDPSIGGNPSTY